MHAWLCDIVVVLAAAVIYFCSIVIVHIQPAVVCMGIREKRLAKSLNAHYAMSFKRLEISIIDAHLSILTPY